MMATRASLSKHLHKAKKREEHYQTSFALAFAEVEPQANGNKLKRCCYPVLRRFAVSAVYRLCQHLFVSLSLSRILINNE